MPNTNPTIVSASLSDKELQDSINKMVANFDKGLQDMLDHSNKYVEKIQASLQKIGDTNFGAKGSNDGGVAKQTKAQNDFTDAVKKSTNEIKRQGKETAMSFDQIAAAQQKAMQSQGDSTLKKSFNKQELQQYIDRLRELQAEYIKVNTQQGGGVKSDKIKADIHNLEELIAKYREILKNLDYVNSRQGTIDVKKWVQDLGAVDDRYKKLVRWYTVLEKEDQRRIASEEKANKKRLADLEKEKAAQDKVIKSYQDSVLKAEVGKVMKMPTTNIDEVRAKFERLSTIIANIRELGILSPERIAAADSEVKKLGASIQRYEKFEQERVAAEQKFIIEQAKEVEQTQTLEGRVKSLAQAIRERLKEEGRFVDMQAYGKDLRVYAENDSRAKGLTIEQQILQQLEAEQRVIQQQVSTSQQLNNERKKYVSPTINDDAHQFVRNVIAKKLGINTSDVINADAQYDSIKRVGNALKQLQDAYARMTNEERNSPIGKQMIRQMQELERQTQQLRAQMSRPISLKDALGGSEKTLDDIAYKMQRLRAYKQGIDLTKPNSANEIRQVDEALARLQKDADKWMSKSQQMIKNNTALGRSWNYMKNRLAFYFTVGAGTQFIKNLIEVRSQYEMNERALGILIDSAERGTQIFNELSQMALVSPYTLIELSAAAKQLTAYDVAAKDVVDTTRRLADMAAAVGIPIERLTYALGQIKAYGYLNSRDARMFANAGIPLVKQLSDYYTELEGRLVSTADVYDRIKKKAIDYNEVMEVINKMTDQGGKFFDFQAKMADTLKVRLANLTLAWNNMLNDMGKESQGVLTWGIGALREMFLHWKQLDSLIKDAAWALGIRTTLMFIAYSALKAGAALGVTTKQMALSAVFGKRLADVLKTVAATMKTVAMSKWTWISLFAIAAVEATQALFGVNEAQKALNESIRNGAKDNYDNISKFLEQYKEIRESLYATQKVAIGNIYNPVTRKAEASSYAEQQVGQDIDNNEAKKAWEAIREQIELTVVSSDKYIGNLLSISNMSERVRQGFNLLDDIQVVNAALKELGDDTIIVSKDLSAWWNAWQAPDGLIGNLKDYQETLNDIIAEYGTLESFRENTFLGGKGSDDLNDYETALERFRDDLQETTDSIINFIELKGWSGDERKINQVFEQITQKLILDNQLDPQKAFTLQTEVEEARSKAAKEALLQRINDERAALKISNDDSVREALAADEKRYKNWDETNGRSKVEWERFTKWLKEQHISETTAMFRNMDEEDIKSLNFQEGKHAEWVTRMVTQYAKEHKMSYDEAFKYLKSWVRSANQWSVFIPLIISTEDKKSVYDQLGEYDKAVDEADAQIERLTKRIGELNAKKQKSKEETQELANAEQELADAQKAKADAEAKGGHGKKEKKDEKAANKAANKAAKQAETELQKALKDELSTIEKVRSIYKDLVKDGASHANAVERATRGWDETVNAINRVLQKNGLQKLDLSKFAGIENPRKLVNMLQSQLNTLLKRGAKPAEIKELQTKINTLEVDADKYDLTKITKGLNSELDRFKEEYELAVAIDADPELGGIFADMFDLNIDQLPHTISEYAQKVTAELNKALKERGDNIQLPTIYLTKDDIDAFRKMSEDKKLNTKSFEDIQKAYQDFVSLRKKAATDVSKIASDYIREYGDLSAQIQQIEIEKNDALMKLNEIYNTDALRQTKRYLDAKFAIEDGARRKQAKATFDALKKEADYERFFTAIDTLTKKDALSIKNKIKKGIIDAFKNGGLTLSQFRKEIKALEEQFDKLSQPTSNWISYLNGGFDKLIQRAKETGQEIEAIGEKISVTGKVDEEDKNYLQSLGNIFSNGKGGNTDFSSLMSQFGKDMKGLGSNISKAGQGMQGASSNFASTVSIIDMIIKNIHQTVQGINSVIQELDSVRNEENKISNAYWKGFSKSDSYASSGWENLKSGNISGAIADTANSIISIFNTLENAKTDRINSEIKESERTVKNLENAYIDLEHAIQQAYGMATIGANMAAKANKELQLEELKRQLTLERSRDSKNRDEDKIIDLQKQIKELEYDIADTVDSIVNDLLGISSVGDALENVMGNIIDAFRSGSYKLKDIMKDVKISFNDMIANMVMKMYTTRVLQPWFEEQWNKIQDQINERAGEIPEKLAEQQTKVSNAKMAYLNDDDSLVGALRALGMDDEQIDLLNWYNEFGQFDFGIDRNARLRAAYEKALKEAEQKEAELQKELATATMPTTDDIKQYAELLRSGQPIVIDQLKEMESFLRELDLLNDKKKTTLSDLQAGISGITESTAGALEAYMNGVSQQVCLQSNLLTQIRDAVVGMDMDVQVATQAQMLLQLQQSYTVQMAIQGILEGWNNPSGQAVRVELVS